MLRTVDEEDIRWLELDSPPDGGGLRREGWRRLAAALREIDNAPPRVAVITGSDGAFCIGADHEQAGREGVAAAHASVKVVADAVVALSRVSKPTIAAVDGEAFDEGMSLALGCDFVVASTRARFASTFVRRGLSDAAGGSWLLPRMVGLQRARELALTGRVVEAAEAVEIGLAIAAVDPAELRPTVRQLANGLGSGPAQAFTKTELARAETLTFEESVALESVNQAILMSAHRSSPGEGGADAGS